MAPAIKDIVTKELLQVSPWCRVGPTLWKECEQKITARQTTTKVSIHHPCLYAI